MRGVVDTPLMFLAILFQVILFHKVQLVRKSEIECGR